MSDYKDFLDEEGKWQCIKCAACCRSVGMFDTALDRGDGTCINLTEEGLCSIYDDRPDFCRVNKLGMSDKILAQACSFIRDMYGDISENPVVKIGE